MTNQTDIPITPRQLELLAKISSGLPIKKAAEAMYITPRSAYNLLAAAKRNSGVGTVEHLVVIAIHNGWLKIDDEGQVKPVAPVALPQD